MLKRIVLSGVLGCVVLFAWMMVANGVLGLSSRVKMKAARDEKAVYEVLKENIVAPGGYIANPEIVPGSGFPAGEPVFSIRYSGMGHEAAGRMLFVELALGLTATILTSWLLSATSPRILSRYSRRVGFVAVIGLLLAASGSLAQVGIGGYPAGSALLLGANDVVSWTLAGLAMAWTVRPVREVVR